MPAYDYTCSACGHLTEVIHRIHDHGPRFCPECGAEGTMKKGFATPAVHFKGSGWAKKDRKATAAPGKSAAPAKESPPGDTESPSGGKETPAAATGSPATSSGDGGTD